MKIITTNALGFPWLQFVRAADIDDPSSELAALSGAAAGALLLVCAGEPGSLDKCALYAWDGNATDGEGPYVVPGSGGYWIAVAGGRINGTLRILDDSEAEISIYQTSGSDQAAVDLQNEDGDIGALDIGATYSQTEVQALCDACETLADDVRNLSILLHAMRDSLVSQGLMKGTA